MATGLTLKKITQERPLFGLVGGIGLMILGVLFSNIPTMIASQYWPSTPGRIISRTLLGLKFKEYDGDYYIKIDGYIRYQYAVDGIPYSSTSVNAIRSPFYSHENALQYPEGKNVPVYYNPRNPAKAVLEPGWILSSEAVGFFPSLVLLGGFYIVARVVWFTIHPDR